jgi:hypothetical protein
MDRFSKTLGLSPRLIELISSTVESGSQIANTIAPYASAIVSIQDKREQYTQLLLEAKDAIIFVDKLNGWCEAIVKQDRVPCKKTWDEFVHTLYEFSVYLEDNYMNPNSRFFKTLLRHSLYINELSQRYKVDKEETTKEYVSNVIQSGNKYYFPNYYRQELAFRLIRLMDLMNSVRIDIDLQRTQCSFVEKELSHLETTDIGKSIRQVNRMKGFIKGGKTQR